jgi:hypothetical protein
VSYNNWHQFRRANKGKYQNIQQESIAYRFSNIMGLSYEEIIKRIPQQATRRILIPEEGKVIEGVEYKWKNKWESHTEITIRVRLHGPDASAPHNSNAYNGWIVRIKVGNEYLDCQGNFAHRNCHNPRSPHYDPNMANNTHIPIQSPLDFP